MDPQERARRGESRWHLPRLLSCADEARQRFAFPPVGAKVALLSDAKHSLDRFAQHDFDVTDTLEGAEYVLCDLRGALGEACDKVPASVPRVLFRVRLDDLEQTKRKERQLHRRQQVAAKILLERFNSVQIEHLLVDKEQERVAFCRR